MPLYRWSGGAVAQMESTPSNSGKVYAILRVKPDADSQPLTALQAALNKKKIAHFLGAENTFIIPEAASDETLLGLLGKSGAVSGTPQIIKTPADKKPAQGKGIKNFIEKHPTLLASLFYNVGSFTWIMSGIQRARHNRNGKFTKADTSEMMVGVMMVLGSVPLAIWGSDKSKHPMLAFSDALSEHLKERGVVLPTAETMSKETLNKSGFFGAFNDFMNKNVFSVISLAKVGVGGLISYAGTKKGNFNVSKVVSGLMFGSAWLATFALDKPHAPPYEFKSDDLPANKSTGAKLGGWLAENPRGRIAAPIASIGNLMKLWGSWDEGKKFHEQVIAAQKTGGEELRYAQNKKYDYLWNIVAHCSFLIGNYMIAKSGDKSAKKIKDFDKFHQEMLTVAANVMANIPEKMRKYSIDETAEYIASIKGVHESKEEIAAAITAQIDQLKSNALVSSSRAIK